MTDPIFKTKDGQQVTKSQLLESGYSEDRIAKGISNGILSEIGDTNISGQLFKTKDGREVTYDDLINSGYSEDRINKGVQNGILSAIEKKNLGENVISEEPEPTSNPTPSPSIIQSGLAEEGNEFSTPFYGFDAPKIKGSNGATIPINRRSIPITPFNDDEKYLNELQTRINLGTTTEQDDKFISKNTRGDYFDLGDEGRVNEISSRYEALNKRAPFEDIFKTISSKIAAIDILKSHAGKQEYETSGTSGLTGVRPLTKMQKSDLATLEEAKQKLIKESQLKDIITPYKEAIVETRPGSNFLQRMKEDLPKWTALDWLANKTVETFYGDDQKPIVEKKLQQLPVGFSAGMNQLKYSDPEKFKRYTRYLLEGKPISASDIATISNDGLDAIESASKFSFIKNEIPKDVFDTQTQNIREERIKNLLDNKEVLYAVISDGIANAADDTNLAIDKFNPMTSGGMFGHRWNYSDEEIEQYGKAYVKHLGLDPEDARVKAVIKRLQDNEGWMPFANSIAKSGNIRDVIKGVAPVVGGVNSTIKNIGLSEAERFSEGIAQGNTDVFERKLKSIESDPVRNAMSVIFEGGGQLGAQIVLSGGVSGLIGAGGKMILGKAGQVALAGDIAAADMAAVDLLGKTLLKSKDGIATFVTIGAQSFDGNYKKAMGYTSDDGKALAIASGLTALEAATEGVLSPLDIARGIGKKFFNKKEMVEGIGKILNDAAIVDKNAALKNFYKASLEGVKGTGKVMGTEIGEELVTQIGDFAANATWNAESKHFKDRDLANELGETVYQTGLSMVIPALISGVGSYKANNFSKGTLLVAAQNRQQIIDGLTKAKFDGQLTDDEYNQKVSIVNTAARANDVLPVKENGARLSMTEKSDYIFSQTAEAVLLRQIEDRKKATEEGGALPDAAKDKVAEKKIKQQQEFRENILMLKPMYHVDGNPVKKEEFNKILKSGEAGLYDLRVDNDNVAQESLRKIGGVDENLQDATTAVMEKKRGVDAALLDALDFKDEEPLATMSDNLASARQQSAVQIDKETADLLKPFEKSPVFMGVTSPEEQLKYIADQAQNISATGEPLGGDNYLSTVNVFGDKLVQKAIEAYPKKTPTVEPAVESKIADIEKRRQEELDVFSEEELGSEFFNNSDNNEFISDGVNKINSKYDAELAALEKPVPSTVRVGDVSNEAEYQKELNAPYKQLTNEADRQKEYNRVSGDFPKVKELVNKSIDVIKRLDNEKGIEFDKAVGDYVDLEREMDKLDAIDSRLIKDIQKDIHSDGRYDYEGVRAKYIDKYSEANRYENKVAAKYNKSTKSETKPSVPSTVKSEEVRVIEERRKSELSAIPDGGDANRQALRDKVNAKYDKEISDLEAKPIQPDEQAIADVANSKTKKVPTLAESLAESRKKEGGIPKETVESKANEAPPTVPSLAENLAAAKKRMLENEKEEIRLAEVANKRVAQMKFDNVEVTSEAEKAIKKMQKVKGNKLRPYSKMIRENVKAFFNEVANQVYRDKKGAKKIAEDKFTKNVVAEAIKMFPIKEEVQASRSQEEVDQLRADFLLNRVPEKTTELTHENVDKFDNTLNKGTVKGKIIDDAIKVMRAIKKISPNMKVIVHDTDTSMYAATGETSGTRGVHFPKRAEIHLSLQSIERNLSRKHAKSTTAIHEGVHPILNAIARSNPQVFNELFKQVDNLADDLDGIYGAQAHGDGYREREGDDIGNMETVVEFIARVVNGDIDLSQLESGNAKSKGLAERIKKILRGFIRALTGKSTITLSTGDVVKMAKEIKEAFDTGSQLDIQGKKKGIGQFSATAQMQAENIFTGEEKVPVFKTLNDVAKWLGAWSRKNRIVKKDLSKASDKQIVGALVEHTKKELEAWGKTKDGYEGFYDEDIPQTLNPELVAWAKEVHGRELTNDEISLYHILSSFASPSAAPVVDSNIGLQIFDKYLRTGEISAYSDKQATIWGTKPVLDKKGNPVLNKKGNPKTVIFDTKELKFNDDGTPVKSQIARAYAIDSLNKFKHVIEYFNGDIKKAVNWIESQHSYEELSQVMGTPLKNVYGVNAKGKKVIKESPLSQHENLSRENGGFGVFAISGPKLGSYILNRVGQYGTVTKDLWYGRTMARLFGEPLLDVNGDALTNPWATTAEGTRKRKLADEAWSKVAEDLGTKPAIIQQRVWDFEKKLWQMLGAESSVAGKASDGLRRGVEEVSKKAKERDAEIAEVDGRLSQLDFVEEGKIPKETVTVTNKKGEEIGQKDVAREDLVNKQNDIKERSEKLKQFIECLTGKKG